MSYRAARQLAGTVRSGGSASYGDRALLDALETLLESPQLGRGIPGFDADLHALTTEVQNRIQKGTMS